MQYYACALLGGKGLSARMARQKRKAHDTVSSEQARATDSSPSQRPGLKYVPTFKKARLKATEDAVEHEEDASACSNTNPTIEITPAIEDFVKQHADDSSMHLPKADSSSDSDQNEATVMNSLPGAVQETIQRSLHLVNIFQNDVNKETFVLQTLTSDEITSSKQDNKETFVLQTLTSDGITNSTPLSNGITSSKQDCCQVVPIPTSEENESVLPHTLIIAPSDNQSFFEGAQGDKLAMVKVICPVVRTPVKPVCGADAVSLSGHSQTCKPSDGIPNEVISLNNADTVVPQVDDAKVPSYSGLSSDDLLQESLGHSKVEAGTEMLRGLIEELSSLNQFIMCRKRELESARRQRNAWLKMQKHLNKEVR